MFLTRFDRAERLRASVQAYSGNPAPAAVADLAQGDAAAVQSAWCGFVPLLAHPVMASEATGAMTLLDAAAALIAARAPAAA